MSELTPPEGFRFVSISDDGIETWTHPLDGRIWERWDRPPLMEYRPERLSWSKDDADPLADLRAARDHIAEQSGYRPTTLVMSSDQKIAYERFTVWYEETGRRLGSPIPAEILLSPSPGAPDARSSDRHERYPLDSSARDPGQARSLAPRLEDAREVLASIDSSVLSNIC